ncbi:MAG: dTDP-glucose 4,6-dehydratase [Gammaproteobacteria bacterium]|nr:dTDP-glucose 4,6-dehydratase [Gammaproteobacteria bacterium]MDH3409119.1 dTDP-glucose 4,6-dehydratase [Gammaproteobacteria bacterium]
MTILVTGGAGFIGTNFVLDWLKAGDEPVVNLDKLTYAGNLRNLQSIANDTRHSFVQGDIAEPDTVPSVLSEHCPRAIVHFAAETHVDRSIHGPQNFIQTNVVGTFRLLEAALHYWRSLEDAQKNDFRVLNVSTDEVFGSLSPDDAPATEENRYAPNSPYSASKAAADHLVRSYFHTYGLPVITTLCSNNYGPYQFPEKLIPLMTVNGSRGQALPIYGDGKNIRDWLYVADHCTALRSVLDRGRPGEVYNIAGNCEMTNVDVVTQICSQLDDLSSGNAVEPRRDLIEFVSDRPGHDRRYALATAKIERELGWQPQETFATGIRKTVKWYLDNQAWLDEVTSGQYRQWLDLNYAKRA